MHRNPGVHYSILTVDVGYEDEVAYFECESCERCEIKSSSTHTKKNQKLQVSKKFTEQRKHSLERIRSDTVKLLWMNSSIQFEGAFGIIKNNYEFRQFLLRGKAKVYTEILMVSMG